MDERINHYHKGGGTTRLEELEILSPRQRRTIAEWTLNRRVLSPKTSNYVGPWSHDFTPWAVRIMEKLSEPGTKQVDGNGVRPEEK
jgi:phage terminase large subunit GpA-like protein